MCEKSMIDEIGAFRQSWGPIPLERVRCWMQSKDIEVLGASAEILTHPPYWERVNPPIAEGELEKFLFSYYERCFKENPDGEWADSRYAVARTIVDWFKAVPDEAELNSQTFLLHMKEWLEDMYRNGDQEIQTAIVTGTLEHVLEDPRWREAFADWRLDPVLAIAYDQAMEWATQHEQHR